jgi:hypothetical protein
MRAIPAVAQRELLVFLIADILNVGRYSRRKKIFPFL